MTASVVDTRTGCSSGLHDGMRITTASVVTAGVLGAVLLSGRCAPRRTAGAWRAVARRLAGTAADVRDVSGGPTPLQGQRVRRSTVTTPSARSG